MGYRRCEVQDAQMEEWRFGIKVVGCRIWMWDRRCRDTGHGMWDGGSGIEDMGCRRWDGGCRMQDLGCGMSGVRIQNTGWGGQMVGYKI